MDGIYDRGWLVRLWYGRALAGTNHGLTLIELLIVMGALAILATLASLGPWLMWRISPPESRPSR